MLLPVLAVLLGLCALVWGADRFVLGAAAAARNLGVSPLVVGLTVVGVGTSAPEMLISALSAWQGNPAIAVGNAIGSNIANVGLVIGATAVLCPLSVASKTLRREYPMMLGVMLVAGVLLLDGRLERADGALLALGFVALLVTMVVLARRARTVDPLGVDFEREIPDDMPGRRALAWAVIGLLVLLAGSRSVVWGAVEMAQALGVSDLLIGLTVVAIGTSLPELAASVAGALKGEPDIALGNVIGSNMFNLLPVLGLPGLIAPGAVEPEVLNRDFPLMLGLGAVLFVMASGFRGPVRVTRVEGAVLLLAFSGYQLLLYHSAGGAPQPS